MTWTETSENSTRFLFHTGLVAIVPSLPVFLFSPLSLSLFHCYTQSCLPPHGGLLHSSCMYLTSVMSSARDGRISQEEMIEYFNKAISQLSGKMGFVHTFVEIHSIKPTRCDHCSGVVSLSQPHSHMKRALSCTPRRPNNSVNRSTI